MNNKLIHCYNYNCDSKIGHKSYAAVTMCNIKANLIKIPRSSNNQNGNSIQNAISPTKKTISIILIIVISIVTISIIVLLASLLIWWGMELSATAPCYTPDNAYDNIECVPE